MTDQDPFLMEIARGIEVNQRGDRNEARRIFNDLWERLGPRGDAYHRCAVAHSMADTCDDLNEELTWDRLALDAAHLISPERALQASIGDVAGIFPSLHLNLGDVYRRLGDHDRAIEHLEQGRQALVALGHDGYAQMVRGGLERLGHRLNA